MTALSRSPDPIEQQQPQLPLLFSSKRFEDSRGWFSETYNDRVLRVHSIGCRFVQDNQSMSQKRGTIRGLHFQTPPMAQAKLVRVLRGAILDIAVDLRRSSPTFGQSVSAELSGENGHQLYVPIGFAHGFCTLEDRTEVLYKVSEYYSPAHEGGIRWDDPQLAVSWPIDAASIMVSAKDAKLPLLRQWTSPFPYSGAPLQPLTLVS